MPRASLAAALAAGLSVLGAASARNVTCSFYGVDFGFRGGAGLVTARDTATLVLGCDGPISGLCAPGYEECFVIEGPSNGTLDYMDTLDGDVGAAYRASLSWEAPYEGPMALSFECDLYDSEGAPVLAGPVEPIEWSVVPSVAVYATGYKLLNQ